MTDGTEGEFVEHESGGPRVPREDLLHNLQCAALVGSLTGNLGHDIRNLVMPALLRLDVIGLSPDLTDGTKRDLDSIRKSIGQLQQLADGLRLFESPAFDTRGASGPTNIREWWNGLRMVVASVLPAHTAVRVDIADDLPDAAIPPGALAQVALSVLLNAKRALTGIQRPAVDVCARRDEHGVFLRITDNGSGMTSPVQARCFEPFFTTHGEEGASGLGLYTGRAVMRRYGGDLSVAAAPDRRGTTVVVHMPAHGAGDSRSDSAARGVRIQVSDPRQAAVLRLILSQNGFHLVSAENDHTPLHAEICDATAVARLLDATGRRLPTATQPPNRQASPPPRIVVIGEPVPGMDGGDPDIHWLDPKDISLVGDLLQ